MGRYAEGTEVTEEASKAELERILRRYGATGYGFMWSQESRAVSVGFRIKNRSYRLAVPMPRPDDESITHNRGGYLMTKDQVDKRYAAEVRRRWRVVVVGLKAKLELASMEEGDFTFEREFMSWAVLKDGRTVFEALEEDHGIYFGGTKVPLLLEAAHEPEL